jgi:hypothetical protein
MKLYYLRTRIVIGLILVVFTAVSCRRKTDKQVAEISISGEMRNADNVVLKLSELDVKKIVPIDSVTLDKDGRFSFKVKPSGAMFLVISVIPAQTLILVASPGEKIHIEGDVLNLVQTSALTGSPASSLMLDFERYTAGNQRKADSLGNVFLSSRSEPDFASIRQHLDSAYQALVQEQRSYMEQFINENSASLASLIVINRKFGPKAVFDENADLNYFQKIDSNLMIAYPGNKHVLDNHSRVESLILQKHKSIVTDSLLTPGMPAPDVKLEDQEGVKTSLSSLQGQVVLIYFWAAMDAESRQFIRRLIPIYKENHKNGFEIYGLALEPNRSLWQNALKLDKPGGKQVNAGAGLQAAEALMYGVKRLPAAILIDRDGKIKTRDVTLDELRKELPKLLK